MPVVRGTRTQWRRKETMHGTLIISWANDSYAMSFNRMAQLLQAKGKQPKIKTIVLISVFLVCLPNLFRGRAPQQKRIKELFKCAYRGPG